MQVIPSHPGRPLLSLVIPVIPVVPVISSHPYLSLVIPSHA